MELIVLFT